MLRLLNASEKLTKRRLLQADRVLCESALQMTMSTQSFRSCPQCGANVPVARKRCGCGCNLKKGRGRPKGTTRLKGYGIGTSGGDLWVPQQRRGMVLVPVGGDLLVPSRLEGYSVCPGEACLCQLLTNLLPVYKFVRKCIMLAKNNVMSVLAPI